ncbi:LacI-family protein transcriptional regulator [Pseudonocardia sp. Ae717_Ps2]|uniref:LacI family DNA-binding transcriptional regulator n=1 Tax=Pseudonocardia sp. Ae717_Ps2 TaxID=1885573 RepID=UPI00094AF699|nr:LacI family DNA-binding transcriptional regulator [Pseudonocardia sp. Ae717_Ps2]OLM28556.1 LacI-family protein transcriptional regulator [Pseudonocardia sp. Ae717_Ps2]
MATMREVAAHAGVSQKTVSRVFNEDRHVTPATREKVLQALRELRYTPNSLATMFRAGRSPVIGIAVPDIVDPFFAAIVRSVGEVAATRNMSTLVTSLADDPDREDELVESLLRRSLSGLILASTRDEQNYLQRWTEKLPIIFVDRGPTDVVGDSFTHDDVSGGRLATEHLIGHGHRRIAFVSDRLSLPTTRGRLLGYRQALELHGLPYVEEYVGLGVTDTSGGHTVVGELLALPEPPTAIFSSNAGATMRLVPALREIAIGLVSFGDFPMASELRPSLTVIDQDPARVGCLAAERVIERLDEPDGRFDRRTILEVSLVERESCAVAVPTFP